MIGYNIVILKDMLQEIGEDRTKEILSDFYCPLNKDIEEFLRSKAIEFEKQGISTTYLVFASHKNEIRLFGFFAVAIKGICVLSKHSMSINMKKRLNKFAIRSYDGKDSLVPSILIAQIGKNFKDDLDKQMQGKELLEIAFRKVKEIQRLSSGKFVYLECQDDENLITFYQNNGFYNFGKREKENYEKDLINGKYLIQMIQYLK